MYRKGLGLGADAAHLAPRTGKVYAHSFASTRPTTLYQLVDAATGKHLKWGITSAVPLRGRYSRAFLDDKDIIPIATGTRREMFRMERWLSERLPGELNKEPWHGTKEFPILLWTMTDTTLTEDESAKLITIGTFLGGQRGAYPEAEAAVDELFRLKEQVCPPAGRDDLRVNLVFDIPGPILPVDYEGVRTGRFSLAKRMLQIQVAVPEGLAADDIRQYLTKALAETVALAKSYVKRRKVSLSTDALESVVNNLIATLTT